MDRLQVGRALPSIALASTRGGSIDPSRLAGQAVLFVYPWTGRPGLPNPPDWDLIPGAHGSTPEAEGFRDRHGDFAAREVAVLGISTQSTAWQLELSSRLRLPFALLSDEGFRFQAALALPTFATGGVRYLTRLTILVANGRIARLFFPVSDPAGHAAEVLAALSLTS